MTKEKFTEIFCNGGNVLIMGCGGGFDTGSALRKALEGIRGEIELPHSPPGTYVNITDSTNKYYLFRLNSSWPGALTD